MACLMALLPCAMPWVSKTPLFIHERRYAPASAGVAILRFDV